jgi:adenylate cyclase
MSVLFADIRGFTAAAEQMDPPALVSFLNEYLAEMTAIVFAHDGVLDKYMGDAIMAFWGAPTRQPDHAERVCRTAFEMLRRLRELQRGWAARGLPALTIGVGINSGPMTAGNVGSRLRFDYTVMGDAVNLASRLEGVNKEYGTHILIGEGTYQQVKHLFTVRLLDTIAVKGKSAPTAIYELIAPRDAPEAQPPAGFLAAWDEAVSWYRERQFAAAAAAFERVLTICPDDGPTYTLLARCAAAEGTAAYRNGLRSRSLASVVAGPWPG